MAEKSPSEKNVQEIKDREHVKYMSAFRERGSGSSHASIALGFAIVSWIMFGFILGPIFAIVAVVFFFIDRQKNGYSGTKAYISLVLAILRILFSVVVFGLMLIAVQGIA